MVSYAFFTNYSLILITMDQTKLGQFVIDAVAAKRAIKTGYVQMPGGLYPAECDSVAGHSFSVAALAMEIAHEIKEDLEKTFDISLNLEKVATLAIFHDYGEAKSGDPGAASHATYPGEVCRLHNLERDGLLTTVKGAKIENLVMDLYDEYRKYNTPESLVVHIADNLEGFEKALQGAHRSPVFLETALRIFVENITLYRGKHRVDEKLGKLAEYLTEKILIPGTQELVNRYWIDINIKEQANKKNTHILA